MQWIALLAALSTSASAAEPARWPAAPPERPASAFLMGAGGALLLGAVAVAAHAGSDQLRYSALNENSPEDTDELCDTRDCAQHPVLRQVSDHLYTEQGSVASDPGRANRAYVGAAVAGGLGATSLAIGVITLRF